MSGTHRWRWTEEQPGVIVIVVLVLAFAFFFPQDACRGRSFVEPGDRGTPTSPSTESGFAGEPD